MLIPKNDQINYLLNNEKKKQLPRDYSGLSQIGHKCHRYLQYDHYWAYETEFSTRILRLFKFGHMMEDQMIEDLASVEIFVTDRETAMTGTAGHWKGHCDGIAISAADMSQRFLIEFKTHNDKSFAGVKKDGVLIAKSVHYDQMTAYMGYLKLPFAFYMAYNKNTSEYYYETIQFDNERFKELQRKEMEVIASDVLLPRIGSGTPSWFECKMCDAKDVCFKNELPPVTCRTCKHVDVLDEGKWACTNKARQINVFELASSKQREACELYEIGEMFK